MAMPNSKLKPDLTKSIKELIKEDVRLPFLLSWINEDVLETKGFVFLRISQIYFNIALY